MRKRTWRVARGTWPFIRSDDERRATRDMQARSHQ